MKHLIIIILSFFLTGESIQAQSLLWEDFSGAFPPTGWTIDAQQSNWSSSVSANAGGLMPEAMFGYYPDFTGTSRLISPAFDLTGVTKVNLEFHHMVDNWSGGYFVGVATRTGPSGEWSTVWQIDVESAVPATFVTIPITNLNVNHPGFQFCFFFNGNTTGIDYWYIDNVYLYAPYLHDIRAENIQTGNQFVAGTPFTPYFKIRNIGRSAETFPAIFKLFDYQGNQVYQDNKTVTNLPMDSTHVVGFTNFAVPDPDAVYNAEFYSALPSDMDHTNDTLSKYIDTYTHKKQNIMLEIVTGTWCNYCPGAAMGAEDLVAHGDSVAVIEYHDKDTFTIPADTNRMNYYQVISLPTSIFNGTVSYEGGSHATSLYPTFLPLYRQQMAVKSAFEMFINGTHTGINYSVDVNIHKLGQFINPHTVLHLALTENHIYFPWEDQDSLQYVLRLMVPDDKGTPVDLTSSDPVTVHFDFTINSHWVSQNLELSAFIQDTLTREILNGNKIWLTDLIISGTGAQEQAFSDRIGDCYPNPFLSSTTIPVFTSKEGLLSIDIWSILGQKVKSLRTGRMSAGRHDISWDGTDDQGDRLPNGSYYIRLLRDGKSASRKIILKR